MSLPRPETHRGRNDTIVFRSYAPGDERRRESLFTLGNGMLCVRDCAPEAEADDNHYPGTYRAGCYDRVTTPIRDELVDTESLVNLPNWLALSFRPLGHAEWFSLDRAEIIYYRRVLHIPHAATTRHVVFRDWAGRYTRFREKRFVSIARPHVAVLAWRIIPQGLSGKLEVRSAILGDVMNANVERHEAYEERHFDVIGLDNRKNVLLLRADIHLSRSRPGGNSCRARGASL